MQTPRLIEDAMTKRLTKSILLLPVLLSGATLVPKFQVTGTSVAIAAETGATSQLTGIPIPRSGAAYTEITPNFTALLSKLAAEKVVNLTPEGDAEVIAWRGDAYREDRVKFTKTAVATALASAGYKVTEISPNELREVNIFEHFDSNDENLPFKVSLVKPSDYFLAVNEAKGKSVVAAWLESDDALALGLLPVQFKAPPKKVPLPVVPAGSVLVKDLDDTMKGIAPPKMPAFPALARKAGTVRGWVKDGAGKPIAGAQIAVHASAGGGFRTTHKARSNAQGLYEVLLPAGVAEVVEAKCTVKYNGVSYDLPLHPVAGEAKQFNAKTGHVENYMLRTWGKYGGTIRVLDNVDTGVMEVTITPQGRLLDGSKGRTFVYRFPADKSSETYLNGMPLGRYTLTARVLNEGESLPLRVANTFGDDQEPKASLPINFSPGYTYSQYNIDKSNSGIAYFNVTLQP